ncbi:MAG: PEGA domain-containing protein [Candidatus Saccharimonadales bacterium]
MEFLDPEEKREKTLRLFMGYGFIAAVIIFSTFMISFILQGFDLFNNNRDVRNGLLFIDSKPVSANIYINDVLEKRTDARFVLPENTYSVRLTEEGYRDWYKDVDVIGGSVTYQIYPRLFPVDIRKQTTATYAQIPKIWTESPSRKWIVANANSTNPTLNVTDTTKATEAPSQIVIPETVLSAQDMATSSLKVVEWSTDNRHFLVQKTASDGFISYVIIDREKPEESFDVTAKLSIAQGIDVRLRDKKYDQYYLLDANTKLLRRASLSNGIEPVIVADGVVSYAPYENNTLLYATTSGAPEGKYAVRILDGATNYLLQPIAASQTILIDIARYEGDWFFVVGSNAQENTHIYINPLQNADNIDTTGALRFQLKLPLPAARYVGFSDNARFIGVQNDTAFTVYDAELQTIYRFDSPVALPPEGAQWLDGHRFHVVSGGSEHVFEFDGANFQTLTEAVNGQKAFYDNDFVRLFTLAPQANNSLNFQVGFLTLTN